MKIPRNLSGAALVGGLRRVGYEQTRQKGDHVYMTTTINGEHHVTVPLHKPVRIGTLAAILQAVAGHLGTSREQLLNEMRV
jgi:predicted RNA binding protein YcfA (HicA-like mRNA interferase family)